MTAKPATLPALCCSILLLLAPGATQAQEAKPREPQRRPRIGVALAGGSARGFAHVGVLRWLHEHRIPVDYVVGTSMGGLIGGFYAAGYSPEEMDTVLRNMDWEQALQFLPPYPDLSFRRKEDRREFPNRFELGLRDREFRLPSGLSPGHGVGLVLSHFSAPYMGMRSFDELPTPFRSVATDLASGQGVTFSEGDLYDALRATMSLPGIFAPLKLGDRVLVDGGVLNNLPVDVAKQMGADVVIAVNLGLPERDDVASLSLVGIADRSIDVMIANQTLRNLQLADLVLTPDLRGLGSTDFPSYAAFVDRGYAEAERKARFLEALALDQGEWHTYLAERARRRRPESITPSFVQVEGAKPGREAELERMLAPLQGRPLMRPAVERALTRLTGLGRYDRADYRQAERDGQPGLLVHVREKLHGPPILNTFLDVDGTEIDDVRFGIGGRLTVMDIGRSRSEWRTDLRLGSQNFIGSEFYWRPGRGPLFFAPRGYADYSRQNLFDRRDRVAEYRVERLGAGLDLGWAAGPSDELRLGYEAIHVNAFVATGDPLLPKVKGLQSQLRAQWAHESAESSLIPRHGWRGLVGVNWVFEDPLSTASYPVFEARLLQVTPLSRRNFLFSRISGGTTGNRTAGVAPFTLGGPFRLSALSRDQLRGNNYYFGSFYFLRSLSDRPLSFLGRTYLGGGYELGDAFDNARNANSFHAGTVGIFSETAVGALFFGAGFGEHGERKAFFRLGRIF